MFNSGGSFNVTLTVTDPLERNDSQSNSINTGSPESAPALQGASLAEAQVIGPVTETFHTTINGFAGQVITIETSPSADGTWSALTTLTNTTGTVEFIDAGTGGAGSRFYRVMVQSPDI